jgi:gliding-associated putative ABC transporter substrate-binding component GldG
MNKAHILTRLAIFLGIIVVINMISSKLYFRLDFTEDSRYTLSNATEGTLGELEDVITITAYFTQDLPPQMLSVRTDFEDLLKEYEQLAGGNVIYEFINPNESEELETEAQQKGVRPVIVNVTESDQVKQLRAYLGAVLQMGEKVEILPVIQPGASMEYDLTTSIKKLAITDKPKLAFLQGHGEPSINALGQLQQQLDILYDVEPLTITDTTSIPLFYKAVVMINPVDTIPNSHFTKLNNYLDANGSIFVGYGNISGDLNQQAYFQIKNDIGVVGWLRSKGINVGNQIIIDATSATVGVQQQQGPFRFNTQIQFPYFPIIGDFADHPASKGIESLVLQLASPITTSVDTAVNVTVLAQSSEKSGLENVPAFVDINRQWTLNDFKDEAQTVAVAVQGPIGNANDARMAIVANGDFVINGEGQQAQQVNPDNINFAANIIDWLSDDTGLVDLRTKAVTNRPLEQIEDGEKALIKYLNVFLPIFLILIYAFIRKQRYLRKKQNWLQGNY